MKILLIIGLLVTAFAIDYCEVDQASSRIFILPDQTRLLNLNDYIKGSALTFEADQPDITIYDSYVVSGSQKIKFKDFELKSIDVRSYGQLIGNGELILMAQKDNQISYWAGDFQGYENLPSLENYTTLTLPNNISANCFDLRSTDALGRAILNCQTIPKSQKEDPNDLLCWISPNDTELSLGVNCNQVSSLAASLSRTSRVFTLNKRTYLFSANKDITTSGQSLSYINIYELNQQGNFIFVNMIDGSSLTPSVLDISDYVITKDNKIIVADRLNSRLIYFRYTVNNVQIDKLVGLKAAPLTLSYNHQTNSLLVGTNAQITEHDATDPSKVITKYEIDNNDNMLTSVHANDKILAFRTINNNLYIYDRNQHKLNYLLKRTKLQNTTYIIVSSQISYLYTFNSTLAQAISISQPYLALSKIKKDQTIKVTASSNNKKCIATFDVKSIESTSDIVKKQSLQGGNFKVDPTTGLDLNLKDYYGGANLKYRISDASNPDFEVNIRQIDSYTFTPSFGTPEKSYVLDINANSFYFLGINSSKRKIFVDLCKKIKGLLTCELVRNQTINSGFDLKGSQPNVIEGKLIASGDAIFFWGYPFTSSYMWITVKTKGFAYTLYGSLYDMPLSTARMTDQYILIASKAARIVIVNWVDTSYTYQLSESTFTPDELESLQQWYPRDVVLDPLNPQVFYVKLLTRIARFVIMPNRKVQFAGIVRTYDSYVMDSEWTFTFTGKHLVTIRDQEIKEEFYDPSTQNFMTLQKMAFNRSEYSALSYNDKTNFVTVSSKSSSNAAKQETKVFVPGSGSIDAQYVEMELSTTPQISANWFLESSGKVFYVNTYPQLQVKSNLPDDIDKEDISLTLQVQSETGQEQTSKATVQGFNFPVVIKDIPNEMILELPASSSDEEMKVDFNSFFNGPISQYSIDCPFCQEAKITLESSITFNKNITDVTSAIDFVKVGDYVVVLTSDSLLTLDKDLKVLARSILTLTGCSNLAYEQELGVFLYCRDVKIPGGQAVYLYEIEEGKCINKRGYTFPKTHEITHFDQMFISYSADQSYLMVLDNDETIDNNKKLSTIKVFSLTGDASLNFITEWDSKTFGTDLFYPINDLDLSRSIVLVTLGNYGIGYGSFTGGVLTDPKNINLANIAQIQDMLLPSSFFKQLEFLSFNDKTSELSLFISTTNSYTLVASFVYKNSILSFKAITQSYNRYGKQRLLNWHYVDGQHIYLSFYNETTQLVTIVYYPRKEVMKNQFKEGVQVMLSKNMVQYHEAFVSNIGHQQLLVSHLTDNPTEGNVMAYHLWYDFVLKLNYNQPGDFNTISIQAVNSYHDIVHTQRVQFGSLPPPPPPPPDDGGLKWYVVLIVATIVLLLVGVAYGLFRYMKKKRADKNVSLLTEREEADPDADDVPRTANPLEERLNESVQS